MRSQSVLVADEVWIATALLHREHPERKEFSVAEIVLRAQKENIQGGGALRPGVRTHATQHCVSNKPANPGRYRMIVETRRGFRRLYREGDPLHPDRRTGKIAPSRDEMPAKYLELLDWYLKEYVGGEAKTVTRDPILGLRGLGKEIWVGEEPDEYVRRLRKDWE